MQNLNLYTCAFNFLGCLVVIINEFVLVMKSVNFGETKVENICV